MYRLAKELKLSKQTVVNWCSGANEPKASQIAELCKYFDCSADYLLGLSDI
ncbi:MAG: helix-turn-helix transcriptional regulator [Clostridiales bacterium]|nr:helix-turn-helix transcriptional regulator [Clostridiales bacterium]